MAKKKVEKELEFDFVNEIIEKEIPIDLVRDVETQFIIDLIKSDLEDGDEDFLYDLLRDNFNRHLSLRDELFVSEMIETYNEDYLKRIIEMSEAIMMDEECDEVLIDGDKKYDIIKNEAGEDIKE
jgi:hypothetical protein